MKRIEAEIMYSPIPGEPIAISGLTLRETVIQSALIHPVWTVEDHMAYLENDIFWDNVDWPADMNPWRETIVAVLDAVKE